MNVFFPGTSQHPIIEKVKENEIFPYFRKQWLHHPIDDSWSGEELYDLIMKPPSHSGAEFTRESRDSPQQHQYQPIFSDLDTAVDRNLNSKMFFSLSRMFILKICILIVYNKCNLK